MLIISLIHLINSDAERPAWVKARLDYYNQFKENLTYDSLIRGVRENPSRYTTSYEGVKIAEPVSRLKSSIHSNPLITTIAVAIPTVAVITFTIIIAVRNMIKIRGEKEFSKNINEILDTIIKAMAQGDKKVVKDMIPLATRPFLAP